MRAPIDGASRSSVIATWLRGFLGLLLSLTYGTTLLSGQEPPRGERNFDARTDRASGEVIASKAAWNDEIAAFRKQVPELGVELSELTGLPRSLTSQTGFLTEPALGNPRDLALEFVEDHLELFGLAMEDWVGYEVKDVVHSRLSGVTRLYLQQTFDGLPVYNGLLQIAVNRDGRIQSVHSGFVGHIAAAVNVERPEIGPDQAVLGLARHLDVQTRVRILKSLDATPGTKSGEALMRADDLAVNEIGARLAWLPIRPGEVRLVWNFQVDMAQGDHLYDVTVDAETGRVWTRFDAVDEESFRVYQEPAESPIHTSPLPPADGRVLVVDPADPVASPNGWIAGGTIMNGNNAHACLDLDGNDACDGNEPSCGAGLSCDFPIDLTQGPSAYRPAAVANLFYWNNHIHDVMYHYGFDEASGNFQVDNFGRGGVGGDAVDAHAQSGTGNCNASFRSVADGSRPRMRMFTCDRPTPARDGDFDGGTMGHEYGHGISKRLVGGPSTVSCLNNDQQAGEGWSDWFGMVLTARATDTANSLRGHSAYANDRPANGGTNRGLPYTLDQTQNDWTYETINGARIPHRVGARWAQAAWEAYWALVDLHGFEGDLANFEINDPNEAGNKRALFYVIEGLKNTPCSPTFTDNRDAIVQVAADHFGGEDVCPLWEAFAAFGLGTDAVSGGPGSTSPTNGFSIPAACECSPQAVANAGADQSIDAGSSVTIGTPALAGHTYSWSPNGETTAQIVVAPTQTTTFTVTAATACGTSNDAVTVSVRRTGCTVEESFEAGTGGWIHAASSTCATGAFIVDGPTLQSANGSNTQVGGDHTSGTGSAFFTATNTGIGTNDVDRGVCIAESPVYAVTDGSDVSLWYFHGQRDAGDDATDFFRLEISTDGGTSYTNLVSIGDVVSNAAWTEAITSVPAGSQVKFRVQASDGTATGDIVEAGVDDLTICSNGLSNEPPTVTITAPANGSTVNEGTSVTFSGTASDAQDGNLSGAIVWSSSLDGGIGSGAAVSVVTLSVGAHVVTASVTDSGGLTASASITVTVDAVIGQPVLLESNASGGDKIEVNAGQEGSQSFAHGSGGGADYFVTKVVIYLSRDSEAPTESLTVSLGTGVHAGVLTGSVVEIAPAEVTNLSEGDSFQTFDVIFTSPIGPLSAGTTYHLNLENESANGKKYYLELDPDGGYPRGTYFKSGSDESKDARFQIWGF